MSLWLFTAEWCIKSPALWARLHQARMQKCVPWLRAKISRNSTYVVTHTPRKACQTCKVYSPLKKQAELDLLSRSTSCKTKFWFSFIRSKESVWLNTISSLGIVLRKRYGTSLLFNTHRKLLECFWVLRAFSTMLLLDERVSPMHKVFFARSDKIFDEHFLVSVLCITSSASSLNRLVLNLAKAKVYTHHISTLRYLDQNQVLSWAVWEHLNRTGLETSTLMTFAKILAKKESAPKRWTLKILNTFTQLYFLPPNQYLREDSNG